MQQSHQDNSMFVLPLLPPKVGLGRNQLACDSLARTSCTNYLIKQGWNLKLRPLWRCELCTGNGLLVIQLYWGGESRERIPKVQFGPETSLGLRNVMSLDRATKFVHLECPKTLSGMSMLHVGKRVPFHNHS